MEHKQRKTIGDECEDDKCSVHNKEAFVFGTNRQRQCQQRPNSHSAMIGFDAQQMPLVNMSGGKKRRYISLDTSREVTFPEEEIYLQTDTHKQHLRCCTPNSRFSLTVFDCRVGRCRPPPPSAFIRLMHFWMVVVTITVTSNRLWSAS